MGYAGKVAERERARGLRARSWTLKDIAVELGVSKSSVSVWVRDVEFDPRPRNRGPSSHKPHPLTLEKQRQLERCREEAEARVSSLTERDFFMYGLARYHGEGFKTETTGVGMANTDPGLLRMFAMWLRQFFEIDEQRLRARLYLHVGLDLAGATAYWSDLLDIPEAQFRKPYRAEPRGSYRRSKHEFGCPSVRYTDLLLHRRVMAMISAVSSQIADPG
jgi:hypothetical protein